MDADGGCSAIDLKGEYTESRDREKLYYLEKPDSP